jgi:bacterioferritin
MQADPAVIRQLNAVLREALIAINQKFLHARMLGNWGLRGLEKQEYGASIHAMKVADKLTSRILFLEGLPNFQDVGRLMIGEDVPEILRNDLTMENRFRDALASAISQCEQQRDYVSRHHLEELQEVSEERIDWLETQLSLIDALGIENYLESAID